MIYHNDEEIKFLEIAEKLLREKHPEKGIETRWVITNGKIEYLKGVHIAHIEGNEVYCDVDLYEVATSDGGTAYTYNIGFNEDNWLSELEPLPIEYQYIVETNSRIPPAFY